MRWVSFMEVIGSVGLLVLAIVFYSEAVLFCVSCHSVTTSCLLVAVVDPL